MNLHLIDGTYELFRAFFAAPSAQSPDGDEVGATRVFMRSMLSLLRDPHVSHVGIAFDTVIESFRNQLFDGYKTGDGIEPSLWSQFPLAEEAAAALGLTVWPMVEFEADDALASAAAQFSDDEAFDTIYLCSPDKDLAQCVVGQRIVCWDRMRKKILDSAGVEQKFGVTPPSIPDYLALVGDSADGIPGLPRWGAKSSSALLHRYTHLEHIPDDHDSWDVRVRGAAGLAAVLKQHRSEAMLYRKLATLRQDVPLKATTDTLQWRGANRQKLTELCHRIGDVRLIEQIPRWRGSDS